MIKSILTAAAIALTAAPVFADTVTSPKAKPVDENLMFGAFVNDTVVPSMALGVVNITSNISCRAKARSKYFELGARDMSKDDSNSQWGTVGSMQAVVWCRDTQAVLSVAGNSFNSVTELRDEIQKAF